MNENLTNEVVESVVEEAMTKNNASKTAGAFGIGLLVGAGILTIASKIWAKVKSKKEIVVPQQDETEEENSEEE